MRRRGQGRRLWHRASSAPCRPWRAPAAGPSSSRMSPRACAPAAPCGRPASPTPRSHLRAERLPAGAAPASGSTRDAALGPSSARPPNWRPGSAARGAAGAACALHIDTGMNRLGLAAGRGAGTLEPASLDRAAAPALLMSHFVSAEEPGRPDQRAPDRSASTRPGAAPLAGIPGLARQFVRHLPAARPALRSRAARLRALWRQPDAGPAQSRCGRSSACEPRILQTREIEAGETVGYNGRLDGARPTRSRPSGSAMPTACRAAPARYGDKRRPGGAGRRRALPAGRPRLHGPQHRRRHRRAGRRAAPARGELIGSTPRDSAPGTIGYEIRRVLAADTRTGTHRLRDPHQPRAGAAVDRADEAAPAC